MKDTSTNHKCNYTRAERKTSQTEVNKSTITYHTVQSNHIIDWEGATTVDKEGDQQVKEANVI